MGSASKIASVCLRVGELICATIVVGILGHYLYLLDKADANANGRITYTIAIAGTSLGLSVLLMPPFMYSFWAFPVDYALFICWMVAFGLMIDLTGSKGCNSSWYWNSWGYYWGGWFYRGPITSVTQSMIGTANCTTWRTSQAFTFIGGWIWLGSGFCGTYVSLTSHRKRRKEERSSTEGPLTQPAESTEKMGSV